MLNDKKLSEIQKSTIARLHQETRMHFHYHRAARHGVQTRTFETLRDRGFVTFDEFSYSLVRVTLTPEGEAWAATEAGKAVQS